MPARVRIRMSEAVKLHASKKYMKRITHGISRVVHETAVPERRRFMSKRKVCCGNRSRSGKK